MSSSVVPLDPKVNPGFLKLDLYCRGLRLHESCTVEDDGGRPVMRARAGLGSGLELILDPGLWVNVPVVESFAAESPYELRRTADGHYDLWHDGAPCVRVRLSPRPAWYDALTSTGKPMRRVGTLVSRLWGIAAIFLFVLIGALSDLSLIWQVGLVGLAIIAIGVLARIAGAFVALNLTPSDLNVQEKLFVGLSTLGKATVQATLAPLVVAYGVQNGETILAIAVMSILVMAPVASLIIEFTYRKLLNQAEPPAPTALSAS